MFGSDFIHITDHRGFESGFWWSDILTVIGVYPEPDDGEEDWVKVKFRSDRQPDLHIVMSMTEFLEAVKEQLNHPPKLYADNKEFLSPAHNEILTFNIDGINVKLPRGDVWMARERCTGSCDLTTYCPFFGKRNIEVGSGCRRIFDAYDAGKYTVSNGIFEEE